MKYKDFETSFRLDQAEKEAASLPPAALPPEAQPTPEEKTKFQNLAELSPRAAILEARLDVEEALKLYAGAVDHEAAKTQAFLPLMRLLRSKGKLDPVTSSLLDDLRAVGNNAAHRTDEVFTKAEALRYRSLSEQVINRLLSKTSNT